MGIFNRSKSTIDYDAAVNRQYLVGHSDTDAERINAIYALFQNGIAVDGYPFEWDGAWDWQAAYDGDQEPALRQQPFHHWPTGDLLYTAMEQERGGLAVVHDHDQDETVAVENNFAEAVSVAATMLAGRR